ncbi:hypothetical protein ABPG72_017534 [Tetrahymena utriculariae]
MRKGNKNKLSVNQKAGFILFVKAIQLNIPYVIKKDGNMNSNLFLLFWMLIFAIPSIRIKKIVQLSKIELLLIVALETFQIEDLYFLVRFSKFKNYYLKDDENGWLFRYICMIISISPFMLSTPFVVIRKQDIIDILMHIFALALSVYLSYYGKLRYAYNNKLTNQESILLIISKGRIIVPTIQAFTYYYNYQYFYLSELGIYLVPTFFKILSVIVGLKDIQNINDENYHDTTPDYSCLLVLMNADLIEIYIEKPVNPRVIIGNNLYGYTQLGILLNQLALIILSFNNLISYDVKLEQELISYSIIVAINIFLTTNNLYKFYTQKYIIYISSPKQLKDVKSFRNNTKEKIQIRLISKKQQSKKVFQQKEFNN